MPANAPIQKCISRSNIFVAREMLSPLVTNSRSGVFSGSTAAWGVRNRDYLAQVFRSWPHEHMFHAIKH